MIVEHWDDNSVIVSDGFDTETATRLRGALRAARSDEHAESTPQEIGLRLFEIPAFQKYAEKIGDGVREQLTLEVRH